jgi:hypothetical protein
MTEEDLEEIMKEWLADLLILADPTKLSDIDSSEAAHDTPRSRKTKKNEQAQDVHSTSVQITSVSLEQGGDDEEIDGTKFKQKKGDVTLPRDKEDPSKKRKVSPPKPSSRKKLKATRTKFETTLTSDNFDFIVATLNDDSLEIAKKKEDKQEEVFSQIKVELQEVQQALRSSRAVSTVPLSTRTPEIGDESAQLHWISDTFEACLRQAHEEIEQATQALAQAHEELLE